MSALRLPVRPRRHIAVWRWESGYSAVYIDSTGAIGSMSKAYPSRLQAEICARDCAKTTGLPLLLRGLGETLQGPSGPGRAA